MRIALALVVSVVVVARVGVAAQTRTFKEQINVSPGQTLNLRLGSAAASCLELSGRMDEPSSKISPDQAGLLDGAGRSSTR
jgi:hypothetical protein